MLTEFLMMDRIIAEPARVEVVGARAAGRDLQGAGGRRCSICGHFSNFEVMAAAIVRAGVDCQITYRATNNPYFNDRRIVEQPPRAMGSSCSRPKGDERRAASCCAALEARRVRRRC